MSYSFTVQAASKAEAKTAVTAKFDEIVAGQEVHETDRPSAETLIVAFVDALSEPSAEQEVKVVASGFVSWRSGDVAITGVTLNASASLVAKES